MEGRGYPRRRPLVANCGVHWEGSVVWGQPVVHRLLVWEVDPLLAVAQVETVEAQHAGQKHPVVLGDLVKLEGHVQHLLVALREVDYPAQVHLGHYVRVVRPQAPVPSQGPVRDAHQDRRPVGAGLSHHLVHVGQSLAASGGECPGSGKAGSHRHPHAAVLPLRLDVLCVKLPVCYEICKVLDYRGLGGDGEDGYHLDPGQANPVGEGLVPRHHVEL